MTRRGLAALAALGALALAGCARTPQAELPNITMHTVGSSSAAACERIGAALSEITAERYGFTVTVTQNSTAGYNDVLEHALLCGQDIDLFCYTDADNMYSLVTDGKAAPLDDWLEEFPALRASLPQDYWDCMTYGGQIVAVPGNNPNTYAVGFMARADVLDALGADAAAVRTLDDLGVLLQSIKDYDPEGWPLVAHFGQVLQSGVGLDPLNNGLGVLMGNTGTTVVNWYDTQEFADLCARMHAWYEQGLIVPDAPLTAIPNARAVALYGGSVFNQRVGHRNIISVNRATGQKLDSIILTPRVRNTQALNICWCVNARSPEDEQRRALQLLELLCTDKQAADLMLYGIEGVDYRRIDENTVTSIDPKPEEEWSTVHWGQPNSTIVSTWVWPDGSEVEYTAPQGLVVSPAYGFTYTPAPELRPAVNSCLEIVNKYEDALLSGYLDPEEALPRFRSELKAAGIDDIVADKQAQLDAWLAQKG